jgi:hypothetical protein
MESPIVALIAAAVRNPDRHRRRCMVNRAAQVGQAEVVLMTYLPPNPFLSYSAVRPPCAGRYGRSSQSPPVPWQRPDLSANPP